MILTVTLNVALDVTYRVDALRPHATHRVREVATRPGGKGVNVAAALTALHEPVVATGLIGGPTGEQVRAGLAAADIPEAFVPIAGDSRRTLVVADGADATGFWEPGPPVTEAEWDAFVNRFRGLARVARAVVLSGSLPAGLPDDAYAQLVAITNDAEVPSIVDAEGAALDQAIGAEPTVVKPNRAELAGFDGGEPGTVDQVRSAAATMLAGGPRAVVCSLGADGLVALTPGGAYRAVPPADIAGNPTGAGDAVVAALARGLATDRGWPELAEVSWREIVTDAVALSAATVAAPVAGVFDPAAYDRMRRQVVTEILPSEPAE